MRHQPVAANATLRELQGQRPLVLVFLKKDCPCSVEFEPFFQQLERNYRSTVAFAGVFDGTTEEAGNYATRNRASYPILADVDLNIVRVFQVENGGYVALLNPKGQVEVIWPGYSVEMMEQLNQQIAEVAHVFQISVVNQILMVCHS
jgi:peroxiredoxin